MTIQYWTLIVELIGSLGVMVTLLYLAIQMRQSTKQTLSENLELAVTKYVNAAIAMMRTEEDADFLRKALNDYNGLGANQKARFFAWTIDLLRGYEAIAIKHRNALIDTRYFGFAREQLVAWITCPGFQELWNEILRDSMPERTRDEIEGALQSRKTKPVTAVFGKPATEFYSFLRFDELGS